jgi:outer membrane lipoprotein-sorting protein
LPGRQAAGPGVFFPRRTAVALLLALALIVAWTPPRAAAQEEFAPEKWLAQARTRLDRTDSYTAVFHKQERIDGKLQEENVVFLKFARPFKIYMKWIRPPHQGRELIYVEGWNGNRIRVHGDGILGLFTVNVDPRSRAVAKENRHLITEAGLSSLLDDMAANVGKGVAAGEVVFRDLGRETVYGRRARIVELTFPEDRSRGYYCRRAILSLDDESRMPLETRIFDWDNRLVERYGYEDIRLDAGLSEADFDPKNPAYGF